MNSLGARPSGSVGGTLPERQDYLVVNMDMAAVVVAAAVVEVAAAAMVVEVAVGANC